MCACTYDSRVILFFLELRLSLQLGPVSLLLLYFFLSVLHAPPPFVHPCTLPIESCSHVHACICMSSSSSSMIREHVHLFASRHTSVDTDTSPKSVSPPPESDSVPFSFFFLPRPGHERVSVLLELIIELVSEFDKFSVRHRVARPAFLAMKVLHFGHVVRDEHLALAIIGALRLEECLELGVAHILRPVDGTIACIIGRIHLCAEVKEQFGTIQPAFIAAGVKRRVSRGLHLVHVVACLDRLDNGWCIKRERCTHTHTCTQM